MERWRRIGPVIWMQTNGTPLLAVKRCSLARMPMTAQDGSSAPGLLDSTALLYGMTAPNGDTAEFVLT